ncbi:S8/S53 family peptidase [Paracoccus sp. SSJ]|uniref:subtilisin-like serine protease QhpE n=1 Tax=Paracoccus sp. SSJ TaxID=3050636 RepID=UPI00254A223E|nr:S8/S53 family peptidase [Paracoccus sp. SSJ]MDK8874915.1 S8/S53 family peptidase [Paracoccus sp. SSJ]
MLRVGVIDSGPGPDDRAEDARAFMADGSAIPALPDRLGHGTAVAAIIRRACPGAAIIHAQVFDDRPVTSALRVAAALRWFGAMTEARPQVICMSLGLAADRAPLRRACEALVAGGAALVAAHPARGAPCFPAAYPGVIAATGDARCGWDDLSQLAPALFGAWCNSPEHGPPGMGGASLGAARIAGHLAAIMARTGRLDGPAAIAALAARAIHHGPERKCGHG